MNADKEKQRKKGKFNYISMRKSQFTVYCYYYPQIFTHTHSIESYKVDSHGLDYDYIPDIKSKWT